MFLPIRALLCQTRPLPLLAFPRQSIARPRHAIAALFTFLPWLSDPIQRQSIATRSRLCLCVSLLSFATPLPCDTYLAPTGCAFADLCTTLATRIIPPPFPGDVQHGSSILFCAKPCRRAAGLNISVPLRCWAPQRQTMPLLCSPWPVVTLIRHAFASLIHADPCYAFAFLCGAVCAVHFPAFAKQNFHI